MKRPFFQVWLAWFCLACLCACSTNSAILSTPTLTNTPATAASSVPPIDSKQPLRVSATIIPAAKGARYSKDIFAIRVLIENIGPDNFTITASAESTTPALTFVLLDREINQTLGNEGLMISQTHVIVEPSIYGRSSYRVLFLGFKQSAVVNSGTHQLIVRVQVPGQEPIKSSVVYEVVES